mmetsp:Transcript_24868/g.65708  ORF Transcript_24868/g.65708 Transcript_24868/m.65708 type:complete len:213 (-) Transcript_24868:397-1035(-)
MLVDPTYAKHLRRPHADGKPDAAQHVDEPRAANQQLEDAHRHVVALGQVPVGELLHDPHEAQQSQDAQDPKKAHDLGNPEHPHAAGGRAEEHGQPVAQHGGEVDHEPRLEVVQHDPLQVRHQHSVLVGARQEGLRDVRGPEEEDPPRQNSKGALDLDVPGEDEGEHGQVVDEDQEAEHVVDHAVGRVWVYDEEVGAAPPTFAKVVGDFVPDH